MKVVWRVLVEGREAHAVPNENQDDKLRWKCKKQEDVPTQREIQGPACLLTERASYHPQSTCLRRGIDSEPAQEQSPSQRTVRLKKVSKVSSKACIKAVPRSGVLYKL